MVIDSKYIFKELGCKKEFDVQGGIYAEYGEGHFYPADFLTDKWIYHNPNCEVSDGSSFAYQIIETVEVFEKFYK